ncbi:hypothetical protein H5410_048963 [Solanum commersonii]|uniref:Uncharacterized protein n=1 Tax=Solanum commersonii TaxID=4109 RepID=A0A9J5XJR4_SOLCO|nr:hypothetical protein H5410_048963 [Solanum commersonii]
MLFLGFGYFVMVLGVTSHKGVVVIQFFQWHCHGDTDIQFSFLCFCILEVLEKTRIGVISDS